MAALNLLRRLAVRDVHLFSELKEGYHYAVVAADCINIGRHPWCILHIEKDGPAMKV